MRNLLIPAALVEAIVAFRASHQAATCDEADAYMNFATGTLDMSFYPSSGNHVLHSLLTRFITEAFGLTQLTFRGSALMGSSIYLLAVAFIVARIVGANRRLQLLGFAILTLNPFVLDYLVASRGYALALGLLASVVALAFHIIEDRPSVVRTLAGCTLISVCCALSISANFSFAFANIATICAFLLTLILIRTPPARWFVATAATVLPGLAVGYALVGETIRNYPRSQLYYGAQTWVELWREMHDAVFPVLNLSVQAVNLQPLLQGAHNAASFLIWLPLGIALWTLLRTRSWAIRFAGLSLAFTLAAHGLAHALQNLLLPMDRTSLFIAFFISVLAVYAASGAPTRAARVTATVSLCISLAIFALAFRTNYFRIWDFDIETDKAFAALAKYGATHKIESSGCTWRYGGAYNFYRKSTNATNLPLCDYIDEDKPPPRSVYFLISPWQDEFVAKAKLKVIYEGPVSHIIVGVAPVDR